MTQTTKTYQVTESALESFTAAVEQFNKRAMKLGCPVAKLSVGEKHMVKHQTPQGREYLALVHEVTLSAAPAVVAGWTFVGHIALEDGVEMLFGTPGESIPASMKGRGSVCDHCGYDRKRTATYVLRHENGDVKAVGRQCLRDFIGVDAHHLASWTLAVGDLGAMLDDEDFRRGHYSPTYDIESFLLATDAVIRAFGWLSRKASREEGGVATADSVLLWLSGQTGSMAKKDIAALEQAETKVDVAEIKRAVAWAATHERSDEDYLHNIGAVAALGAVTLRTAGVAASILQAYRREMSRQEEKKSQRARNDVHVGTLKKRATFDVKVLGMLFLKSSTLVKLEDKKSGGLMCWFAYQLSADFKIGAELNVLATPKEHSVYGGEKQTIVARVAIKVQKPKKPKAEKSAAQQ